MKISFEGQPEAHDPEHIVREKAFVRAQKSLEEYAIRPEEFTDLYGKENVEKDNRFVDKMEDRFKADESAPDVLKKIATIFEAIFNECGESCGWFGPNTTIIKTSRYDDIAHGVDEVVEFEEGENTASWLALAIDVTFSQKLDKKFRTIYEEIDQGSMARIKYFKSERMNIRGEKSMIPHVVIGADLETVSELMKLWDERKGKTLSDHFIQFQILEEILMQCESFASYAKSVNKNDICSIYEKSAETIRKIIDEKKKTVKDTGVRDKVHAAISEYSRMRRVAAPSL
jgi:hypothetical protein